jgi:serine/threonine-protein kinase
LVPILASNVGQPPRYLVMPWLEGTTFEQRLAGADRPAVGELIWTIRQVTAALEALHRHGWTHGDVKPGNVILSPQGHATLIDAGFAERLGEVTAAVDRPVMGTCAYMAPELLGSRRQADIRSDLYSVGVMMYEALAGRLPLTGTTAAELATAHRTAIPRPLRQLAPHVPRELGELIHRLMAKDPLRRPADPAELLERLVRLEIATFAA